ncbi:hypothetical protein PAPYR_3248 [Paratrimastix pyriformis]|uniref:CN hydrolase domain-containing protein n=1 Tax=Paratrimastix pyriformis TaxID=342808 RepID=A0ABQ8UV32_9EUKA|nr:hypothetical protein PAPYR_3248 [Paratrimastix pyriformis]
MPRVRVLCCTVHEAESTASIQYFCSYIDKLAAKCVLTQPLDVILLPEYFFSAFALAKQKELIDEMCHVARRYQAYVIFSTPIHCTDPNGTAKLYNGGIVIDRTGHIVAIHPKNNVTDAERGVSHIDIGPCTGATRFPLLLGPPEAPVGAVGAGCLVCMDAWCFSMVRETFQGPKAAQGPQARSPPPAILPPLSSQALSPSLSTLAPASPDPPSAPPSPITERSSSVSEAGTGGRPLPPPPPPPPAPATTDPAAPASAASADDDVAALSDSPAVSSPPPLPAGGHDFPSILQPPSGGSPSPSSPEPPAPYALGELARPGPEDVAVSLLFVPVYLDGRSATAEEAVDDWQQTAVFYGNRLARTFAGRDCVVFFVDQSYYRTLDEELQLSAPMGSTLVLHFREGQLVALYRPTLAAANMALVEVDLEPLAAAPPRPPPARPHPRPCPPPPLLTQTR